MSDDLQWIRMPFDAFKDERILLQLYESTNVDTTIDAAEENAPPLKMTSATGGTMSWDELHQDADVARRLLFARKYDDEPKGSTKNKSSRGGSLVLNESALLGDSAEAKIISKRQLKKNVIYTRMMQAYEKIVQSKEKEAALPIALKAASDHIIEETKDPANKGMLSLKLFSLASCRMQLTIMKALGHHVQQECIRDIVGTILEFPAMALSHTHHRTAEETMMMTLFNFAQDQVNEQISQSHYAMDENMLLMLSLGISSGLVHFLLQAVDILLASPLTFEVSPLCQPQYDLLMNRLERHAEITPLSAFEDGSLLHSIRLKSEATVKSITSDGSHVYFWCPSQGLSKVNIKNNHLEATVPSNVYLEHLTLQPHIIKAISGDFVDVTDDLEVEIDFAYVGHFFNKFSGRLLMFYIQDDALVERELSVNDELWVPTKGSLVRAIFGSFHDITAVVAERVSSSMSLDYSDDLDPQPDSSLLLIYVKSKHDDQLKTKIVSKHEAIFPYLTQQPVEIATICSIGEYLYLLPPSNTRQHLLRVDKAGMSIIDTVPNHTLSTSQYTPIGYISEGNLLYCISACSHDNGYYLHKYDVCDYGHNFPDIKLRIDHLPIDLQEIWQSNVAYTSYYTNGFVICIMLTTLESKTCTYTFFSSFDGSLVDIYVSSGKSVPSAFVYDAKLNAIWGFCKNRQCLEAYQNNGQAIPLNPAFNPQLKDALTSPVPSSVKWIVKILSKIHKCALPYLHPHAKRAASTTPFAIDLLSCTFESLVRLVNNYGNRFCTKDPLEAWEIYSLLAALDILTANVIHLNRHDHKDIVEYIIASPLAKCLSRLTRFPESENNIVQAALRLYIASLDIFYTCPLEQLEIALAFLKRKVKGALKPSEGPIVQMLLQRLSSLEKVKDIILQPNALDHLNVLLKCAVDLNESGEKADLVNLIYGMMQGMLWGASVSRLGWANVSCGVMAILNASIEITSQVITQLTARDTDEIDHSIESSIVGKVIPFMCTALHHVMPTLMQDIAGYQNIAKLLLKLLVDLGTLSKALPVNESLHGVSCTTKLTKILESPHDYQNNMHVTTELHIPGAKRMTITFDSNSRTEAGYDYVTFYKDNSLTTVYGEEKYSGRGDDHNWPGVNGRPPLVIESDTCIVLFHTDGSGIDWGYKFTAIGEVDTPTTCLSMHWLSHIEESISSVLAHSSSTLIRTKAFAPLSSKEVSHKPLLSSRLLQAGPHTATGEEPIVDFLRLLIDPQEHDSAMRVVTALKKHTAEDQGSIEHINRAVRATAAAILHHNLWGMDVYQWAKDESLSPTAHVLKAWKIAQKMRQWFDVGDAAEGGIHAPMRNNLVQPGLKRQPSAYKGASEEAIMALCSTVVERAQFLLSLTPASFAFVRAAKVRWGLLAKYKTVLTKQKSWLHLVREVEAATELKSMLEYRRSSYERSQQVQTKSITELVLEFLQSDVMVSDMQEILAARKQRATLRSFGISIVAMALHATSNTRTQLLYLDGMARSLHEMGQEDNCPSGVNYLNSLNGCEEAQRQALGENVLACLKACTSILEKQLQSTLDTTSAALVTTLLKAVAMDYDVRDSTMLYESKILPQILRLLPSDNLEIRRAAQSILRVLLSRFVAVEHLHDEQEELSLFQKQLLAAVRLQLEGIVHAVENKSSSVSTMSRYLPGTCAPFLHVLPNHSICFWIYVEESAYQYALKVGDEVRRGPHWTSLLDEDGGETGTGTITGITGPTSVQVKWELTNQVAIYTWDPRAPEYQVQLVDEGIGGMVFLHGNRNMVSETEEMVPWSHYGMFLTDDGQLKYIVSTGTDKDVVVESAESIHMNAWNHICIVKKNQELSLYLNGVLDTHHVVESDTRSQPNQYEALIETTHPTATETVAMWPVSFPGATSLVVTFDPLTQLDKANGDYVCIYKHGSTTETWGNAKYTSSFPGVLSQCPLVIPADSVSIAYYSRSSSVKWGFRLLVSAQYEDARETKSRINPFPFYFGEPPARVLDAPSSTCWLTNFDVYNLPLTDHEVQLHMRVNCQDSNPQPFPIDRTLHTLGLIKTCADTSFGRSFITTESLIRHLLTLAFLGPIEASCGALYVLVDLAPALHPNLVIEEFGQAFPDRPPFITMLLDKIGEVLSVWQTQTNPVVCYKTLSINNAALSAKSEAQAYIKFLRALCRTREWSNYIFPELLLNLQWLNSNEVSLDNAVQFGRTVATIAVLGGDYDGVVIGSRVRCCVNIDGKESIETGSVIQFHLKGESRMASVLFDCDSSRPVDVPVGDIACENEKSDADLNDLFQFASDTIPPVLQCLSSFLNQKHPEQVPQYKSRRSIRERTEVIESDHPYANDSDNTYTLDFPNADSIVITFDALSSTETDCDYICFRKRDGSGYYGEERYSGQSFPGRGLPPLTIPASCVDVLFHSDSTNNDWGFRITATAKLEDEILPPEMPPTALYAAWIDLRARSLRVMHRCMPVFLPQLTPELLPELAHIAVMPFKARPLTLMPKSQVFESKHPYANSISEYMAVTFKGAKELTISFDAQSRTEDGCDYVVFFKDKTLSERWGHHQYTGRAGTENWPGFGGRPPLVIPADNFTLLWCTDSSNVDWGWKFVVKATFPSLNPLDLSPEALNQRAYHLQEMLFERMQPQEKPKLNEFKQFTMDSNHVPLAKQHKYLSRHITTKPQVEKDVYRVEVFENVAMYAERMEDSEVIDVLTHHMLVKVKKQSLDWLYVETSGGDCGWCKARRGDVWLLLPVASSLEYVDEDMVVLGVDDNIHSPNADVDDYNEEQEELVSFTSHFTIEEFKGQSHRLFTLAVETFQACTIQSARACLLSLFQQKTFPLNVSTFGSPANLLEYLLVLLTQSASSFMSEIQQAIQSRLYEFIQAPNGPQFLQHVVDYCTSELKATMLTLPKSRAVARTVESTHPYGDNMDSYWKVEIPGCHRIKIVFDPRSKTEAGCDWLCFYNSTDRTVTYGEAHYTGRGGTENWPGCGGRPPLYIDADSFELYFHSDASGNDWGFAFTAYGELTTENEEPHILSENKMTAASTWLLTNLTAMQPKSMDMLSIIYSPSLIEFWCEALNSMPRALKVSIVRIITNAVLDHKTWLHVAKQRLQLGQLRAMIKKRMISQHRCEERNEIKSEYLQALVQSALALDYAVEMCGFILPSSVDISPITHNGTIGMKYFESLVMNQAFVYSIEWNVKNCSDTLIVGIATPKLKWSCAWQSVMANDNLCADLSLAPIEFGFEEGDRICFVCDFTQYKVILRKNGSLVHTIAIPKTITTLLPLVVCKSTNTCVVVSSVQQSLPEFPDPHWYAKLMESNAMLLAEAPELQKEVIYESSHPLSDDAVSESICIPGAVKLEVRFDRQTQMGSQDRIELRSEKDAFTFIGLNGQQQSNHEAFGPIEGVSKSTLQTGDLVVRSDDWVFNDEDGGPGSYGHVVEIVSWRHRPGMGVKVKWQQNNFEGVYRYGYNGYYDVTLARKCLNDAIWIDGDSFTFHAYPNENLSRGGNEFKGSLDFNHDTLVTLPVDKLLQLSDDFCLQWWLRLGDTTKEEKRQPQTIFLCGNMTANACLHISATQDYKIRVMYKTPDFLDSMLSDTIQPNTWVQLSLVGSGSDVTLYKNGEKWVQHIFYGRTSYTTPFENLYLGSSTAAKRVGFKQYNGLLGQVYDVKLWDAPLNPTDLRREYFDRGVLAASVSLPRPVEPLWTTINKNGRDCANIKSSAIVENGKVYYEVTLLSSGSIIVGWVSPQCYPSSKSASIGEDKHSYALDVNRQYMWHDGPVPFSAPRDIKAKAGDIVGCLLDCDSGVMSFTLNGQQIGDSLAAGATSVPVQPVVVPALLRVAPILREKSLTPRNGTPRSLDALEVKIAELTEMGCSRQKAIEALERNNQNVAQALEWLLHNPSMAVPAPGPHVSLIQEAIQCHNRWKDEGGLSPAISLSPLGAQGVSWNLGQKPFTYLPVGYAGVITTPTEQHSFLVYDWAEDCWEGIKVRHKLHDQIPRLLHRWQLNEGTGNSLNDTQSARKGQLISTNASVPLRSWKAWLYSPLYHQVLGAWGYKFTVFAHFYKGTEPRKRFIHGCAIAYPRPTKQNVQLVEYVNQCAEQRQWDTSQLLRLSWSEVAPLDNELIRWPLLCEIAYGHNNVPIDHAENTVYANHDRLASRFKYLQTFNIAMHRLLPWVHFSLEPHPRSLEAMILHSRGLIFNKLKKSLWDNALKRSQRASTTLDLTLNRPKAMRQRASGLVDEEARSALFTQAFRQLNAAENYHFRRSDNVYYVKFLGENAEDAGGPYRETFCQYSCELQSSQLPLLLRTPNAAHNVGAFREKWVLNPSAFGTQSRLRRRIFEFLGKLMGAIVRSRDYIALDLALVMWKWLVHEPLDVSDLESMDRMLVQSMAKIRTIDQLGVTEEMFEDIVLETFTTLSTDNRMVEIKPNGKSIPVTFATRCEFADLVEHFRLHEFDQVLRYVELGLGKVLPLHYLRLFTASEFEKMVCGSPEVNISLLQQCTEYSSCAATDQHIVWFWATLNAFSHQERSAFLRFVWGRSRLPNTAAEFPQWFKLQSFSKTPADSYLPVTHTCFFALELPPYSSQELLSKKLLYAIYNCQEIDADGDSVAANQLGWEE